MHAQRPIASLITHVALFPLALVFAAPLLWTITSSLADPRSIWAGSFNPWIPTQLYVRNYTEAWSTAPFGTFFINSVLVNSGIVLGQIITATLAAYAFARMRFRGNNLLFLLFVTQMMMPIQATFVSNYFTMQELGLLDTRIALILPYIATGYGTFLLRQTFKTVPRELEDAALIDGCGSLRFLWHVLFPLARPTVVTLAIISLITHWNEYFWPLIVTNSNAVRTLPIGLGMFAGQESGADITLIMAATSFVCLPMLIVFLICQRRFIQSFMFSGMTG